MTSFEDETINIMSITEMNTLLNAIDFKDDDDIKLHAIIPPEFDEILTDIAQDGMIRYDWKGLRKLFRWKICLVLDQYFKSYGFLGPITQTFESRRQDILTLLDEFEYEPPFTIQRLAEVLQRTKTQYRATHPLMNAINRLLSVTTSMSDYGEVNMI